MADGKGVPFYANPEMQTPEGQQKMNEIILKRNMVDHECVELLAEITSGYLLLELIEYLAGKDYRVDEYDNLVSFRERALDALDRRSCLSNEMIKLLTGQ